MSIPSCCHRVKFSQQPSESRSRHRHIGPRVLSRPDSGALLSSVRLAQASLQFFSKGPLSNFRHSAQELRASAGER